VLARTVPPERRDERLDDVVAWLGVLVRTTDSSLVDEWEAGGLELDAAPPTAADEVVHDRRGLKVLVRNALFRRVRLAALRRVDELGRIDLEWGFGERRWRDALEAFYAEHEELRIDADARSERYLTIDETDERTLHVWHVGQIFSDGDGDHDFGIMADVDLDATQDGGTVVFHDFRFGSIEELLEAKR